MEPTPTPSGEPTPTPTPPSGDGTYTYTPAKQGLHVGDDIDLSQTYYVNINEGTSNPADWREVTISKDTYYTVKNGDTYSHYVQKTEKYDGFYGDADAITGWTPITGEGMYYMKDHNTFLQVQAANGTLTHDAYSNKLIASKNGRDSDGLVTGPSESIGGWDIGTTNAIVVERDGTQHQVLYANKGSTFHYNLFVYYRDTNGDIVFLTQGANESDGDSKYFSSYPGSPKSDTPTGVGKYYYTYNNTLGSYGGKGYYTGTYYKAREHQGKVALYFVDGGEAKWLSTSGVQTQESARTTAIHDQQVVYTGPLYQLQTLQRATYFSYTGLETPVVSRLYGDTLTNLTLCTRTMSGDVPIDLDDGVDDEMGTLVDTTNNFSGNLFIQKRLYRDDATGTYNIKLESWATGDMSTPTKGDPTDIVLVVDLSNSMWQSNTKDLLDENGQPMYRSTAVIRAISAFIDKLHEMDPTGETYRVSIVSFSGAPNTSGTAGYVYLFDGQNYYYSTSDINSHAAASLKPVDAAGVTALKDSIDTGVFKEPKGDNTYPVNGLDLAETVLSKRTTYTDRPATVIMFTDGTPGTGTGRGISKYSDPAIDQAYDLKHNYNATIFTVGLFNFDDENLMGFAYDEPKTVDGVTYDPGTYSIKDYMEAVSSKYPNAKTEEYVGYQNPTISSDKARKIGGLTPENTDKQYYFNVNTNNGAVGIKMLVDAFTDIAKSIATTDVPVDNTSILKDVINTKDFALPDSWTVGTNVSAETVKAAAINSRKEIQWSTAADAKEPISADNISATGNTIQVKGFNYAEKGNFSAPAATVGGQQTLGKKLVVRIKGLMPKHGGEVYSNSEAGILNAVKNADGQPTGQFEMYLGVESPFDTIAKRSYVVDFNASMKVAENGKLATTDDAKVSDITARPEVSGDNGTFTKSGSTILYQLKEKKIDNQFRDYSYTGSDTALAFGQYYKNDTRAVTGKTADAKVTLYKQVFDPDTGKESKVPDPVDKAWQVVNMIPASSIYYDDDLKTTTATIGDGSGYNVAVEVSPETKNADPGRSSFAFTGTGIDIYCTTDNAGGYAQAKVDGEQVQTMKNYSITTRYNVPTFSFRGLEYGKHLVELNILSKSNYRLDGVRIYGPEEDQTIYAEPTPTPAEGETATNTSAVSATQTEQYGVYLNLRDALMNDKNKDKKDNFTITNDAAIQGALFVDDSSKLVQLVTATEEQIEKGEGIVWQDAQGNTVAEGTPGAIAKINYYQSEFAAYTENSPKHEIYLQGTKPATDTEEAKPGQALIFELSPLAAQAAKSGNLWIGLSAPDAEMNGTTPKLTTVDGKVTINGTETAVTSGVDMYYPITKAMLGDDGKTVTLSNTGSAMISVTNLKITGIKSIYDAANAAPTPTPEANTDPTAATASVLSVEDAMSMVFEPVTMRSIKLAAHNGVDPDLAVVEPEPTQEPEPSPTAEPEVTPDPTPAPTAAPTPVPTQAPNVHTIVKQLISNFVSSLFRSIARLFG